MGALALTVIRPGPRRRLPPGPGGSFAQARAGIEARAVVMAPADLLPEDNEHAVRHMPKAGLRREPGVRAASPAPGGTG